MRMQKMLLRMFGIKIEEEIEDGELRIDISSANKLGDFFLKKLVEKENRDHALENKLKQVGK